MKLFSLLGLLLFGFSTFAQDTLRPATHEIEVEDFAQKKR
jgi:hypothetical protein